MKNKSRLKSRCNSPTKNAAVNTTEPAPEAVMWLGAEAVHRLADDLTALLENRADEHQRQILANFVINIRNMAAMEAMRNVPQQGWFFVN